MSTTIASTADEYTPILVDGYKSSRAARNVLHPIIGTGRFAVTLRESGLRSGTLRTLFASEDVAQALVDALSAGEEMTLTSTDRPIINMQFVASGDAEIELDDGSRNAWWVSFEWQETD